MKVSLALKQRREIGLDQHTQPITQAPRGTEMLPQGASGIAGSEPVALWRLWAWEPLKAWFVNTLKLFLLFPDNLFSSEGIVLSLLRCVHAVGACALVPTDLHKTMKLKWANIFNLGATMFSRNLVVLEFFTCPNESGAFTVSMYGHIYRLKWEVEEGVVADVLCTTNARGK